MQYVNWIGKAQVELVTYLAQVRYHGIARNKLVWHFHGCAQIIWLKHQLLDYDVKLVNVPLYYDDTSAINLTKNSI